MFMQFRSVHVISYKLKGYRCWGLSVWVDSKA